MRKVGALLVGGGIASASAAAELRRRGFDGSIVLATREHDAPYHRPPITKAYLQGHESRDDAFVHPLHWYADNEVELLTRTSVDALEPQKHVAKVGKEEMGFKRALIATGAMVRRLQVDGAQLEGIHYLRTLGNADALRRDADRAEHVVIVGGSYIATEVAASLAEMGKRSTLIMQERVTLERTFGARAGRYV